MASLTFDLGGTTIKLGIVANGSIVEATQIPAASKDKLEQNLERASVVLDSLLEKHAIRKDELEGVGLSFPGIVDSERNRVTSRYIKYGDATDFDFQQWALHRWDLPLVLENDARAALIGEWQQGAGKGYDDICMITLGTGVGSAVLIKGKLLKGRHHIGGNLWGHISVRLDGGTCNCGYIGCLETEASSWVLAEKLKAHTSYEQSTLFNREIFFADVLSEAAKGDQVATEIQARCLHAWGICAVNMVHAYDPQVLIVSGGIMEHASVVIPHMQTMIDQYAWLPPGTVKVLKSEQIVFTALFGLAYLITMKNAGAEI